MAHHSSGAVPASQFLNCDRRVNDQDTLIPRTDSLDFDESRFFERFHPLFPRTDQAATVAGSERVISLVAGYSASGSNDSLNGNPDISASRRFSSSVVIASAQ